MQASALIRFLFVHLLARDQSAFFFATTVFFTTFAGLALPNQPLKIFPFFVFASPRPMIELVYYFN